METHKPLRDEALSLTNFKFLEEDNLELMETHESDEI